MYEVRLSPDPSLLYFATSGRIYALISCQVIVNYFEILPAPIEDDITFVANATGGRDYTVNLRMRGTATDAPTLRQGTFPVELPTLATGLDEIGIRTGIDDKHYNFAINIMLDGVIQKTGGGTITNDSDIDID